MKIWQRIFLVTLLLVICSMFIVGNSIVNKNFHRDLDKAIASGKKVHRETELEIQTKLLNEKIATSMLFLSDELYFNILLESMKEYNNENGVKIILSDLGQTFSNKNYQKIESEELKVGWKIIAKQEKYYLIIKDSKQILGRNVWFFSEIDVSEVYKNYCLQMEELRKWCVAVSVVVAVLLVIVIKIALHPIKKIQKEIHEIVNGNYGRTLSVNGNTELTNLAVDVNNMSATIQKKISEMEEVLENRKIFIGDMTHEMKTPLTSILGFADILSVNRKLTEEQRIKYSECIYQEAKRLKNMSGKLMELIQVQGKLIELKPVNLGDMLEKIVDLEQIIWQKKKIKFSQNLCEVWILGDEDLLKSLFLNLIDNAGKASTVQGVIDITIKKDSQQYIGVFITDQGVGIPEEEIKKITEPFYMVDKSRTRKEGGVGLGLALCVEIIKLHKGKLEIKSCLDKGSTFSVYFPVTKNKKETE